MGTDTDQQGTQKRHCRNQMSEGQYSPTGWERLWRRRKGRWPSPWRCTQVGGVVVKWRKRSIESGPDSSAQF